MITLKKNKHFLIRQQYQYGGYRRDDMMVVKYLRKATKNENLSFMFSESTIGHIGKYIIDNQEVYFLIDEVIAPITVDMSCIK